MAEGRETLISERLRAQMDKKALSIRDVAEATGLTYEHIRNIARGNVVPSKFIIRDIAKALDLSVKDLEKAAVADRIRIKYGTIPLELSGKNPELEPIERAWLHLSEEHKKDIISMAQTYAKRDQEKTA